MDLSLVSATSPSPLHPGTRGGSVTQFRFVQKRKAKQVGLEKKLNKKNPDAKTWKRWVLNGANEKWKLQGNPTEMAARDPNWLWTALGGRK